MPDVLSRRSAVEKLRLNLKILPRTRGKRAFIEAIPANGKVLDVGCGNDSPFTLKTQRSDVFYVGLDIGDYRQTQRPDRYADRYIITTPEKFSGEIKNFREEFDAVISAHNIEHCLDPEDVLRAMLGSLKKGGRLYLSFPCEASVSFPKRSGTLNFYDDTTHSRVPDYRKIVDIIESEGLDIDFSAKRYRPAILFSVGLALEPISFMLKRTMPLGSTWALYGFETIIWASRRR